MIEKQIEQHNAVVSMIDEIVLKHKLQVVETVISSNKVFITFKRKPNLDILSQLPGKCGKFFVVYS